MHEHRCEYDFVRQLERRTRELMCALEMYKDKLMSEMTDVDKVTLAKLNEIMSDFYDAKAKIEVISKEALENAKNLIGTEEIRNELLKVINEIKDTLEFDVEIPNLPTKLSDLENDLFYYEYYKFLELNKESEWEDDGGDYFFQTTVDFDDFLNDTTGLTFDFRMVVNGEEVTYSHTDPVYGWQDEVVRGWSDPNEELPLYFEYNKSTKELFVSSFVNPTQSDVFEISLYTRTPVKTISSDLVELTEVKNDLERLEGTVNTIWRDFLAADFRFQQRKFTIDNNKMFIDFSDGFPPNKILVYGTVLVSKAGANNLSVPQLYIDDAYVGNLIKHKNTTGDSDTYWVFGIEPFTVEFYFKSFYCHNITTDEEKTHVCGRFNVLGSSRLHKIEIRFNNTIYYPSYTGAGVFLEIR